MAVVRILVDGYSLLHNWPQLARGKPRHSETARAALIAILTRYQDAAGTPISVFFDGTGTKRERHGQPREHSHVEVLFSHAGWTADQMIERTTHRLREYGEVLAVTDDHAERDTVTALGGSATSCLGFIQTVESTLAELSQDIRKHNVKERNQFKRSRTSK